MLGYVNGLTLKGALFLTSATTNATSNYSTTGELAATGNYAAGGASCPNATSASTVNTTPAGDIQYWTPSGSIVFPANMTSSGNFDIVMIYNTSDSTSLGTWSLGGSQSIIAGQVTITMPTNNNSLALVRLS